jgi:hypothetical protein
MLPGTSLMANQPDVQQKFAAASTLRQFTDAVTTMFGRPLEIVAPRLVRLGLQPQF